MRCAGKVHRQLLEIPDGTIVDQNAHIVLRTGRVVGGRWCNDAVTCTAPGFPCWANPAYADLRAPMRLYIVNGRRSAVPCRARCVNATGQDCECECGGTNHGRG